MVVCSKNSWNGPVGDTIRAVLTRRMEETHDADPHFTLINFPQKDFSYSQQTHHNILIVENKPDAKNSKVETLINVWAHPQRVIKIHASSDNALIHEFGKNKEAIFELFNQNERTRYRERNALVRDNEIEKMLTDKLGIKMVVSKDFKKVEELTDFVLLRSDTNEMCLGLMIYTFPYKDTTQITLEYILSSRNSYSKKYCPCRKEGSVMTTDQGEYGPISQKILFKEMFARETRGTWRTQDNSAEGSFVNYAVVDAPRQRIVVFDGYTYSTNKKESNKIRQLESIIWEAQFCDPKAYK